MADNKNKVERDKVTDSVVDVKLDEVIAPGDPRWGLHNPLERETDTLSVHEQDIPVEAEQVDVPQSEPVPSDELYRVDSQSQPSQAAQADAAKSDEKPSKSKS